MAKRLFNAEAAAVHVTVAMALLMIAVLAAPKALAQGACTEIAVANSQTAEFDGFGCLIALAGDTDFTIIWNLSAEDHQGRPVTLSLQAAEDQRVDVSFRGASEESWTILRANNGAYTSADWYLLPGEYRLDVASRGAVGELALVLDQADTDVSYSAMPAGTSEAAAVEDGEFERLGSLHGGADYVRWTVPADTGHRSWLIQAEGTPGHPLTLKLFDSDGLELMHYQVEPWHLLEVRGTHVPVGINTFALSPVGQDSRAGYHLRAVLLGEVAAGVKRGRPYSFDAANYIDLARGVVGSLEQDASDYYSLAVAPDEAGWYDLALGNAEPMTLCIHGSDRHELVCEGPERLIRMPRLFLEAGQYWFVITGTAAAGHAYWLHFTPQ